MDKSITDYISFQSTFAPRAKETRSYSKKRAERIEAFAFSSLDEDKKKEENNFFIISRVRFARENYSKISDMIRYLTTTTKMNWYKSKIYYWLNKL